MFFDLFLSADQSTVWPAKVGQALGSAPGPLGEAARFCGGWEVPEDYDGIFDPNRPGRRSNPKIYIRAFVWRDVAGHDDGTTG